MALAEQPSWVPEDTFGARLLRLRRALGLKAEDIATLCDLNRATWSTWENGASPRNMAQVVEKIHVATGASREWLMWGGDSTPGTPKSGWCTVDERQGVAA